MPLVKDDKTQRAKLFVNFRENQLLMRKTTTYLLFFALSGIALYSCQVKTEHASEENPASTTTTEDPIKRGAFLVQVGGCNDCHTPKMMTDKGPAFDMSKMLSGHQANIPTPAYDKAILKDWVLMHPQLTAAVGPWGVSYAANLTPHETGLGNWSEENFLKAMKEGKHLGMDNQRPIMPPMPWQGLSMWPDEDLKAVFAYLKSIPPIDNLVPAYQPAAM